MTTTMMVKYTYNIILRFPTKNRKPSMGYTRNTRNTRNLANHVIPTKRMCPQRQPLQTLSITEYLSAKPAQSFLIKTPSRASAVLCLMGPVKFVSSLFLSRRACWSRRPSLSKLPCQFQGPHAMRTMTYQMRRTQMVRCLARRASAKMARTVVALSSLSLP